MTTEEKKLLLTDLCARLPYGVILRQYSCTNDYYHNSGETIDIPLNELIHPIFERGFLAIRPYLRPMSSMTEEEDDEWLKFANEPYVVNEHTSSLDWLNAHHFDYRGLIEKDLALEAPEGMYN